MPRLWTWMGVLALFAGAIGIADRLGGPAPAAAQGGADLSQPIPPATAQERAGSIRNQIGWTAAKARWGENMPTGRLVPVAQVEARFKGGYLANEKDARLQGTSFYARSGESGISSHASTVASHAFGPDSAGENVTIVYAYEAGHWMTRGILRAGTPLAPLPGHAKVVNHSWISASNDQAWRVLRRVDYLAEQHDVVMVVGVDNKAGDAPMLLASAYNVISVGNTSGNNSDGPTRVETEGRAKPELVAPGGKTSWAAGVVTGCAAALIEVAERKAKEENKTQDNTQAAASEVIKAVLLAGAHKPDAWSQIEGEPLDRKLGAGIVDLDRSIVMLEAGAAKPNAQHTQRYGWSYAEVAPGKAVQYQFEVDKAQGESTFALTWHRRVVGLAKAVDERTGREQEAWDSRAFIPNLDLSLIRTDAQGNETEVAVSASEVDNVELLVLEKLEPGQYTLRVERQKDDAPQPWDFAVAWRVEAE